MTQDKIEEYQKALRLMDDLFGEAGQKYGGRWREIARKVCIDAGDFLDSEETKTARLAREYPGRKQ